LAKLQQEHIGTELLNLSNPEKSVVSAGKLFNIVTIQMLKKIAFIRAETSLFVLCVTV